MVPNEDLDAAVERQLDALRAVDPVVSRAVKTLMVGATASTPAEQLAAERAAQVPLLRKITGTSG